MGTLQANEMARLTTRNVALSWHLTSNHYPPVDARWVPICARLLSEAEEFVPEFDDRALHTWCQEELAEGLTDGRGRPHTNGSVMDGLHLWDLLTPEEEDES